jgi:hypothetical protein
VRFDDATSSTSYSDARTHHHTNLPVGDKDAEDDLKDFRQECLRGHGHGQGQEQDEDRRTRGLHVGLATFNTRWNRCRSFCCYQISEENHRKIVTECETAMLKKLARARARRPRAFDTTAEGYPFFRRVFTTHLRQRMLIKIRMDGAKDDDTDTHARIEVMVRSFVFL